LGLFLSDNSAILHTLAFLSQEVGVMRNSFSQMGVMRKALQITPAEGE